MFDSSNEMRSFQDLRGLGKPPAIGSSAADEWQYVDTED